MRKILLIFSILILCCNIAEAHSKPLLMDGVMVFNAELSERVYTYANFVHSVDNTFTIILGNPDDKDMPLEMFQWYFFNGDEARRLFQKALNAPEGTDKIGAIEATMKGKHQTLIIGYTERLDFLLYVDNGKDYGAQGFILTKAQLRKLLNVL